MVKTVKVEDSTLVALRALRRFGEVKDDTMDDVIRRLIRFYLTKPSETKKSTKGGNN
jgi:hypothetical protein